MLACVTTHEECYESIAEGLMVRLLACSLARSLAPKRTLDCTKTQQLTITMGDSTDKRIKNLFTRCVAG